MSISAASLIRSPANITWNGINMWGREDIVVRAAPVWKPVETTMYGAVDKLKTDLVIKVPITLWGAYENLSTLFPSYLLNPTLGNSLFAAQGGVKLPLVINATNGDIFTFPNAFLTRMANLHLGVDNDLFAAAEFTCLLSDNANPESAGSYYTITSGAYSNASFAKTNFKRTRFTGAWGTIAGFGAMVPQKGIDLAWHLDLKPVRADGLGTIDYVINNLIVGCKCIPIGPTLAQFETVAAGAAGNVQTPMGALLGGACADLVWTGANSGPVITIKNAGLSEHGWAFSREALRVGETAWESTVAFTAGVPAARGAVA
jgi:hypothetical protein